MAKADQLRKKLIPLLILLFVIAITVGIFLYRERLTELRGYGYLGVFLVSLAFNATVILPAGNIILISIFGTILPSATLVGQNHTIYRRSMGWGLGVGGGTTLLWLSPSLNFQ